MSRMFKMYVYTIKVCGCFDGLPLVQTPSAAEKHKNFSGLPVAKTISNYTSSTITTPGNHSNGSYYTHSNWLVECSCSWWLAVLFKFSFRLDILKEETKSLVLSFFWLCLCLCVFIWVCKRTSSWYHNFLAAVVKRWLFTYFKFLSQIQNITFKTEIENQYGWILPVKICLHQATPIRILSRWRPKWRCNSFYPSQCLSKRS